VEDDAELRERAERLRDLLRKVEALLGQTDMALEAIEMPTVENVEEMDRLRGKFSQSVQDYMEQNNAFLGHMRDEVRKIEEANRKAAMSEKRPKATRDDDRIQKVSEQLSRDLRLERIDAAIKELLDFLADVEFFAANASTGRKRRLRSLQNAIEKALQK
jgi:hypothetical protein